MQKKYYNIEFLRFIFAVSIVYFHLLHSAMMPYTGNSTVYQLLADQAKYTKYIVECFFIISGYFLYQSVRNHPERSMTEFLAARISRLWPVLACSVILSIFINGKSLPASFVDLFFLQSSGLATDWKGLNWYVSAFFLAEAFYFMLYKCCHNSSVMKLLTGLLAYFGYAVNINSMNGGFGRQMVYGVINLGLARAVAGIGLGYLLADAYRTVAEKYRTAETEKISGKKLSVFISIVEICTFAALLEDFFAGRRAYRNQVVVVILFSIFLLCLLTRKGIFSKITDNKTAGFPGKYAYSVYVMQEVAFGILQKTFWKDTYFLENYPAAAILISVMITFALGMVTYYLVEKPGAIFLKRKFQFLFM